MAEKYYSLSPYVYCANNPPRYIDINGDSITLYGSKEDLDAVSEINNENLARYYSFSIDSKGKANLVATNKNTKTDPKAFAKAEAFYKELNAVVNGNNMAHVKIVRDSENALLGNFQKGHIDIGDISALPKNGGLINQAGALIHELVEQYATQVLPGYKDYEDAHRYATRAESNVVGVSLDPDRYIETATPPRPGPASGFIRACTSDKKQVQFLYFKYNNVTRVGSARKN